MLRVGKSKLKALAAAATLAAPVISLAQVNGTWSFAGNGNWSVSANWENNASPASGAGTLANFGGYATLSSVPTGGSTIRNINMDANRTIGRINFAELGGTSFGVGGGYSITGASTISLANLNGETVTLNTDGGTNLISAPITVIGTTFVTKTGAGTLILGSGANTFANNPLGINGGVVVAAVAGSVANLPAIATANGAVFEIGRASTGQSPANMGAKVVGLGAFGAPNGTVRVAFGTGNQMQGNWFVLAQGTLNAAAGTSLSIAGNIFDSNDNALNGFTKSGAGSFTANGMILSGNLSQTAGDFIVTGAATLSSNVGTALVSGGNLNLTGGTFGTTNGAFISGGGVALAPAARLNSNVTVSSGTLANVGGTVVGNASVNGGLYTNSGTHTGNITVGGGTFLLNGGTVNSNVTVTTGTALFNGGNLSTLVVNGGFAKMVQQGSANLPSGRLTVKALNIGASGKLDVSNNTLVVDYTGQANPTATIRQYLINGISSDWSGNGALNDSLASGGGYPRALGYADNAIYGDGTFPASSVIVKHTWYGDADLNNAVDFDDINLYIEGFFGNGSGWLFGDFDYSGTVDVDDNSLLIDGFFAQGGTLGPAMASDIIDLFESSGLPAADVAALTGAWASAVPEPGMIGGLSVLSASMLARRRRRQ